MTIKVKQTQEGAKKYHGLEIYRDEKKIGCYINVDDDFNATLHTKRAKCILSFDDIKCIQQAMEHYQLQRKFEREINGKIDPKGTPNIRGGSSSLLVANNA